MVDMGITTPVYLQSSYTPVSTKSPKLNSDESVQHFKWVTTKAMESTVGKLWYACHI